LFTPGKLLLYLFLKIAGLKNQLTVFLGCTNHYICAGFIFIENNYQNGFYK